MPISAEKEICMTETEIIKIEPAVLSSKEAALYLGVGRNTFWNIVSSGKIGKGLVIGERKKFWRKQVLDDFLNSLEQEQDG